MEKNDRAPPYEAVVVGRGPVQPKGGESNQKKNEMRKRHGPTSAAYRRAFFDYRLEKPWGETLIGSKKGSAWRKSTKREGSMLLKVGIH